MSCGHDVRADMKRSGREHDCKLGNTRKVSLARFRESNEHGRTVVPFGLERKFFRERANTSRVFRQSPHEYF